jgi:hypothetical protein
MPPQVGAICGIGRERSLEPLSQWNWIGGIAGVKKFHERNRHREINMKSRLLWVLSLSLLLSTSLLLTSCGGWEGGWPKGCEPEKKK